MVLLETFYGSMATVPGLDCAFCTPCCSNVGYDCSVEVWGRSWVDRQMERSRFSPLVTMVLAVHQGRSGSDFRSWITMGALLPNSLRRWAGRRTIRWPSTSGRPCAAAMSAHLHGSVACSCISEKFSGILPAHSTSRTEVWCLTTTVKVRPKYSRKHPGIGRREI